MSDKIKQPWTQHETYEGLLALMEEKLGLKPTTIKKYDSFAILDYNSPNGAKLFHIRLSYVLKQSNKQVVFIFSSKVHPQVWIIENASSQEIADLFNANLDVEYECPNCKYY